MPAGDRRLDDLKQIPLRAPDRGRVHAQFVRQSRQAPCQDNKFGHIEIKTFGL